MCVSKKGKQCVSVSNKTKRDMYHFSIHFYKFLYPSISFLPSTKYQKCMERQTLYACKMYIYICYWLAVGSLSVVLYLCSNEKLNIAHKTVLCRQRYAFFFFFYAINPFNQSKNVWMCNACVFCFIHIILRSGYSRWNVDTHFIYLSVFFLFLFYHYLEFGLLLLYTH